jgi:acyl dehydratase
MIYFEDLQVGQVLDLGQTTVSAEEIVDFAREWDPQPMHVNAGGAADGLYDGLIASGWHTVCLWMRQACDNFLLDARSMGSPGVDQLRWTRPVRPGDTLTMRGTVMEARASKSRPDIGTVNFSFETLNQDGEIVMTMRNAIMFGRRQQAEDVA